MKSILVLFSVIALVAAEDNGPLSSLLNCDHPKNLNLDVSHININFYDFQKSENSVFPIQKAAQGILSLKKLDKTRKFIVFVHGYATYINHTIANLVRDTFKNFPKSYLIIADHSAYTNDWGGKKKTYERSVKHVYDIGLNLAQMLAALHKGGISHKNIHAIGHSLGGQILGYAGDNFIKATGKKIARITALDPAGPCFTASPIQDQVRSGVAEYVEVYHCNAGLLGTSSVLADVNFFANEGKSQPQCLKPFIPHLIDRVISSTCSHNTCVAMWMASVAHRDWFPAYKCDDYKKFQKNECSRNQKTTAGFWHPGGVRGVYYFSTKDFKF